MSADPNIAWKGFDAACGRPNPSLLVQHQIRRSLNKAEWIAYDTIQRLYDQASERVRGVLKPEIDRADERMATLFAAEQRRFADNARRCG